jgi:hypothetical protein
MYSQESEAMERLPEEEKRESLFDDHQEEMAVKDDPLSYRQPKTKTHSKPTDIDQPSKQVLEKEENPETNMAQMQMI